MKVRATGNTTNSAEKPPTRKSIAILLEIFLFKLNENKTITIKLCLFDFSFSLSVPMPDSDNIINGNTTPIASQKAFNIIADSLRRIDVSANKTTRFSLSIFFFFDFWFEQVWFWQRKAFLYRYLSHSLFEYYCVQCFCVTKHHIGGKHFFSYKQLKAAIIHIDRIHSFLSPISSVSLSLSLYIYIHLFFFF